MNPGVSADPAEARGVRRSRPGWRFAEARRADRGGVNRRVTLSEDIVDQVLQALFEHRIRPGDFLGTEATFAEDFGVSRVAVRDAMRALLANGVITIRKGAAGGVHVAHGNLHRISDALAVQIGLAEVSSAHIIDAHFALVILSAELAAQHATGADVAALDQLLDHALAAGGEHWGESVYAIHLALARASRNPALVAQMKGFAEFLQPFYQRLALSTSIEAVVQRYRTTIDAVRRRDPMAAFVAMYEHLRRVRDRQAAA
jgi:GntR family transcriptional regulator, transcriptional repressor for pyruvate dehydrogenase complex